MLVYGITLSALSLFILPVSQEYGLSRADANSALILLNIGNGIAAPFLGRFLDRYSIRWTMIGCAILLGASFATIGLSHSILASAAVLTVPMACGFLGSASLALPALMGRWFVAHRGKAMALYTIPKKFHQAAAYLALRRSFRIADCQLGVFLMDFTSNNGPIVLKNSGSVLLTMRCHVERTPDNVKVPKPAPRGALRLRTFNTQRE